VTSHSRCSATAKSLQTSLPNETVDSTGSFVVSAMRGGRLCVVAIAITYLGSPEPGMFTVIR